MRRRLDRQKTFKVPQEPFEAQDETEAAMPKSSKEQLQRLKVDADGAHSAKHNRGCMIRGSGSLRIVRGQNRSAGSKIHS